MFEATGHRLRQGIVQGNLVALAIEQGHLDEALRRGIENLELASEVEDIEGMVAARSRLGDVRCQIGDYAAAREDLEAAVATGREYEMSYFVAFSLCGLAGVALGEGDPASAWRYAEQAGGRGCGGGEPSRNDQLRPSGGTGRSTPSAGSTRRSTGTALPPTGCVRSNAP